MGRARLPTCAAFFVTMAERLLMIEDDLRLAEMVAEYLLGWASR